jgi:hypothetical protein
VRIYYTFRDTTFGLSANLVWEVLPCYVAVRVVRAVAVRLGSAPPAPVERPGGPALPGPRTADGIA